MPETVEYEGLRVSRFEVTRAQYAAFDPKYQYPAGTGNYPASGLTFEQAKAYAAWLAATTGEPWRLPALPRRRRSTGRAPAPDASATEEETGRDDENTLDRWAGYAPSPEDAARLREKASALGGTAPLLTEVGLFRGRGEESKVYDLGGNVAEWTVGADGTGVLAGGSADLPAGAIGPFATRRRGLPRLPGGRHR